jgi:putative FmdB family regulatory protein
MPVYDYVCDCGKEQEMYLALADVDNPVKCMCGKDMRRLIAQNQGKPIIYDYYSENLQTHITSPKQKAAVMKAQGVEPKC